MNQPETSWSSIAVVNLLIDLLTPFLLLFLGLWVNRIIKRFEATQWANQKVIEKRIAIFDDIAPLLNDLLCYYTLVGNWKELTLPQIIESKRSLDKKVHINAALFSKMFLDSYFAFIRLCFDMYTGTGEDAKIRTNLEFYENYTKYGWDKTWNNMFSSRKDYPSSDQIRIAYNSLMERFSIEMGVGLETSHKQARDARAS